ncbi:MAG TPA: DUF5666 domain-containing protein [Anaerolineales bacterium]|nr:DUF5666 domain-containing protein [Anaerolineales bacterium]
MKKQSYIFLVLVALIAVFVSACGGAAAATDTSAGSDKPRASLVEFTGVIEAIDGNQWTVNGQVITVDPTVLRDGPFVVGDTVKVEAEVQSDGSVVITRVETPVEAVGTDDISNDNSNANINDDNSNASLENANGNLNDNTNSSLGSGVGNSNGNSNESLSNGNTNDDDHGGNSNGDDDDDNGNSNGNSNGDDDDDHGGNSNGSDDH